MRTLVFLRLISNSQSLERKKKTTTIDIYHSHGHTISCKQFVTHSI